ncbi:MAG: squalene synthase HpnC [Candidatus Korobacteraceae bacterium]
MPTDSSKGSACSTEDCQDSLPELKDSPSPWGSGSCEAGKWAGRPLGELLAEGWSRLPAGYRIPPETPALEEAEAYCRRLARSHYENFSVATWFLPKRLHQHFFNVYAYCRISDDLGDDVGAPPLSLALLDRWEDELNAMYRKLGDATAPAPRPNPALAGAVAAGPRHPVFIALSETVRRFGIPRHEFADLLTAFRQDQTVARYQTFDDVLGYCHNSANPVGRLVLYLCGYSDAERQQLSDCTCTALQLANFWQDVSVDYLKGRIYLPLEDMRRFGVPEQTIAGRAASPEFLRLMRYEVEVAREWFARGLPLAGKVDRELALDIELFTRGGQEILNAIERQGYDVLKSRPVISKGRKLALLGGALWRRLSLRQTDDGRFPGSQDSGGRP